MGRALSNGPILSLNSETRVASLVQSYEDKHDELFSASQDSFQLLDNGNVVMKEYGSGGDVRLTLGFGFKESVMTYRGYRFPWKANPAADPVVAVKEGVAIMSWNGATKWRIYKGLTETETELAIGGHMDKIGFETPFNLRMPNS